MNKKLCVLTGVGPETGTGAEIARNFSENGYHVAMIARTEDNPVSYTHLRAHET